MPTRGMSPAAIASSATMGTSGVSARNAATMMASARVSAAVTGEASALSSTPKSVRYTSMTAVPAS